MDIIAGMLIVVTSGLIGMLLDNNGRTHASVFWVLGMATGYLSAIVMFGGLS